MTSAVTRVKRGNPNWGKPNLLQLPHTTTAFENLIKRHGLATREEIATSSVVIEWVHKNFTRRYVPEWLITRLGLDPEIERVSADFNTGVGHYDSW